jgi:DNA (cytosine-5)-methyltransferase 1
MVNKEKNTIKFIDLFCGIGGFRIAAEEIIRSNNQIPSCVFSSDIDPQAQDTYEENFGDRPFGDITQIHESDIPDHDILFAGFPCQAFSICGNMKGFEDTRGTLFFHIARILKEKKPKAFVLENVKMLKGHDNGKTLKHILKTLEELGYNVWFQVLNALDFGLPQKRERIFIVGCLDAIDYTFPIGNVKMKPLSEVLEKTVDSSYYASQDIRKKRQAAFKGKKFDGPTIWHENKSGNISAYPYSCAMRAGASYNYLLVDGERRLTEREMLRLQGFPDSYKIVGTYSTLRKQTGNSLPIPCARAVFDKLIQSMGLPKTASIEVREPKVKSRNNQFMLFA